MHDAESELNQNLLIRDYFPGRYSTQKIWRTENANRKKKCFLEPTFKGLSTDIYGKTWFYVSIFNVFDN